MVTPDTDWFSPPSKAKLHISEWPFIVASLRHTCAIFMLSNQHLGMPHLWGGMDYLSRGEVLTNTHLDRWAILERNGSFVYIEKVLDLWVQLMKNGSKNKSVAFIFLFSVEWHNRLNTVAQQYECTVCLNTAAGQATSSSTTTSSTPPTSSKTQPEAAEFCQLHVSVGIGKKKKFMHLYVLTHST